MNVRRQNFRYINYAFTLFLISIFINCNNSKQPVSLTLKPYYNSYTFEGKEYSMGDSTHIISALEGEESYMINKIDLIYIKTKSIESVVPLRKIKLKAADVKDKKNKFKIGVIDINNNGIFNEEFTDQYFIAPYQSEETLIEEDYNPWIDTIKNNNVFSVNNIYYKLEYIDKNGKSLTINTADKQTDKNEAKIRAITSIYELFELKDLKNKPVKSAELFSNRPLYLEFWFNGCSGCVKSFNYIKSLDVRDFDIVGVKTIDNVSIIESFNRYFGYDFAHYQIKESVMKRIGNMGVYPSAVNYDKNGLLVDQFYNFPYNSDW